MVVRVLLVLVEILEKQIFGIKHSKLFQHKVGPAFKRSSVWQFSAVAWWSVFDIQLCSSSCFIYLLTSGQLVEKQLCLKGWVVMKTFGRQSSEAKGRRGINKQEQTGG